MQLEKVRVVFQRKGYMPNTYIDKNSYYRLVTSLMEGREFVEDVANELWMQAAGDRQANELRVDDICSTIVDAQNILRTKIAETNDEINSHEMEKKRFQANQSKQSIRRIEDIDQRLEQLYADKQSFEEDFRMLTEPFGIQSTASVRKTNIPTGNDYGHESSYNEEPPHKKSSAHNESFDLKVLLYLTLIYGFFEIIIIYGKYDFLNLIVLTCLLSIYLMNFFDRAYIRLTLALIITSLILDIVWLCLYAKSKWNVSTVSNDSLHEKGFLRFIVFFTVVLMIIKLAMAIILFKYRNAQTEEKYSVSVGLMTILISGNRSNPFSKQISNIVSPT